MAAILMTSFNSKPHINFYLLGDSSDKDDLVVRISLNKDFKKNDYGEAIFYKDNGEILAAVYPKMGRMVVWNASVPFIFKPPAMSYVQAQYDIVMRLSTSKEKAEQNIRETKVLLFIINIYIFSN